MKLNRWYHVILTLYGNWLPGDPRGFRTRKHAVHVEGDYKRPPPAGKYVGLHRFSQHQMSDNTVVLNRSQQQQLLAALLEHLRTSVDDLLAIAVASRHVHLQFQVEPLRVKGVLGSAKRHCWHELHSRGWKRRLWARGSKIVTIHNREHQVAVHKYVLDHDHEGALVWSRLRDKSRPDATGPL